MQKCRREMKVRERLALKLTEALGFVVEAGDLEDAKGHWRTSHYADVVRWDSPRHSIASWDSMTDCVNKGFEVTTDRTSSGARYQIDAK